MQKKLIVSLIFISFLIGCTHHVELTNFQTGEELYGAFNDTTRETWVEIDGIRLTGKYASVSGDTVGFSFGSALASGSSGVISATGSSMGWGMSNAHTGYVLLKNPDSKLMMEVIVNAGWDNHGWGEARTNDGRTYKVVF